MRRADPYAGVGESLQADVMRFMAIIAFCLIAILALVRSADPAAEAATASPPAAEPVRPAPVDPALLPPAVETAPVEPAPIPPAPEPAPMPADAPVEAGLTLSFASDGDFLRLVNRGDIRVFAHGDGRVLEAGPGFAFAPATAPGTLHELLPRTIPTPMLHSLEQAHGAGEYRWAVALPANLARRIEAFVNRGATGALIIDRYGEVRHHGAD